MTIAQRACSAVRIINRLPYNQSYWCHLDHICNQSTSNVNYHQCCWWHCILLHRRTSLDVNHCGGWTQIFSICYWSSC